MMVIIRRFGIGRAGRDVVGRWIDTVGQTAFADSRTAVAARNVAA